MPFVFKSIAIKPSASWLLSLLHVPPSHKKIYIPLSLVHLIYTAGDKCMRQNACLCDVMTYLFDIMTSLYGVMTYLYGVMAYLHGAAIYLHDVMTYLCGVITYFCKNVVN